MYFIQNGCRNGDVRAFFKCAGTQEHPDLDVREKAKRLPFLIPPLSCVRIISCSSLVARSVVRSLGGGGASRCSGES